MDGSYMKKICLFLGTISLFFVLSGCSFVLGREADPVNVYKSYIDTQSENTDSQDTAEYISSTRTGSVFSIASTYYLQQGGQRIKYVYYSSGIILNAEGYILSVASSVAQIDGTSPSSTYAILSSVYNDDTEYKITLVDSDESSGLALFRFYDNFYYKDAKGDQQKGFQFIAEFSGKEVYTGDSCWAVGNSLGDIFDDANNLSITGGVIAQSTADEQLFALSYNGVNYSYMIATAPVCPEMSGGALFDRNGYLIGMFASKIVSTDDSNSFVGGFEYLSKMALFYKTDILIDYVNHLSENLQTVIPMTIAKIPAAAEV